MKKQQTWIEKMKPRAEKERIEKEKKEKKQSQKREMQWLDEERPLKHTKNGKWEEGNSSKNRNNAKWDSEKPQKNNKTNFSGKQKDDRKENTKLSLEKSRPNSEKSKSYSEKSRPNSENTKINSENTKINSENTKINSDQPKLNPQKQAARKLCPVFEKCGGCQYLMVPYKEQLIKKQKYMKELLKGYGPIEPIIGMQNPAHYRNKVTAAFALNRKGEQISGIYEEGTHNVIPVESCLIENEKADAIIGTIRGLLRSFKIKTYDEDTGYGLLRHVLVRTAHETGEIMVVLVLGSPILPSKNNFVKAVRKEHPEITTIVINVNDRQTSMVLGERNITLFGKGYIEDVLCGKKFRISPNSFYQVNSEQTEKLYSKAIELADLKKTDTVIDAYCGIGTIGMIASEKAGRVIGVELNPDAVRDAKINIRENKVTNLEVYEGDAGEFMEEMADNCERADVVFMDPPRTGSSEQFMDAIAILRPERVVYISCGPESLKRDLDYMKTIGYKVKKVVPVDMFPYTEHVETVCLLSKKP